MKPRLLFYVQHLLGVGHVKRAAAIARAATEHFDVHVALGGMPVALADFGSATLHQLPPARAEDLSFKVLLDAAGRPIDDGWRERRKAALLALAEMVAPRVLLVEHYPFGRGKFGFELLPLFALVRARAGTRILCSVREVLVEKRADGKAEKVVGLLRQWFDAVLVHGDEAIIEFAATFPAAAAIADMIEYTGYVVDTVRTLAENGIESTKINKVLEGRPHIEDAIRNRQVQLVINTTDSNKAISDSKSLRRATLMQKVPYYTTISGAESAAMAIKALKAGNLEVRTLQSYFA
jgi:predicted glycosyltransferase